MNNSDNSNNANKMYSNYDPNNNPSRKMLHINTGYDKNQKKAMTQVFLQCYFY